MAAKRSGFRVRCFGFTVWGLGLHVVIGIREFLNIRVLFGTLGGDFEQLLWFRQALGLTSLGVGAHVKGLGTEGRSHWSLLN